MADKVKQRIRGRFCDIFIEPENPDAGIVIEVKYSASLDGMEKCVKQH